MTRNIDKSQWFGATNFAFRLIWGKSKRIFPGPPRPRYAKMQLIFQHILYIHIYIYYIYTAYIYIYFISTLHILYIYCIYTVYILYIYCIYRYIRILTYHYNMGSWWKLLSGPKHDIVLPMCRRVSLLQVSPGNAGPWLNEGTGDRVAFGWQG